MKRIILFLLCAICLSACKNEENKSPYISNVQKIKILPQETNIDSEIGAFIASYKTEKDAKMSRVIGYTEADLPIGRHDSPLGTLVAKMMFVTANQVYKVDMAITNFGGIRRDLFAGDITLGDVYEILPFDNISIVLSYSGSEIQNIANAIAAKGGEAMYGISFNIVDGVAENIMIQGSPLDFTANYTVVTNDYLQKGNDQLAPMANYIESQELPIQLRDIAIEYVEKNMQQKTITNN